MSRPSFAFQPRCLLLGLMLLLAGCIQPSPRSDISRTLNDVSFAPPPPLPPGAATTPAGVGPVQVPEPELRAQIYGGRPVTTGRAVTGGAQRSADGVQLNFEQAEIRDVIKVILGDILGRTYTVDSDVQGQVTLSTSAPMSEGDLLAVLETVLRANGATLVDASPGTFRIMPVDAAIGRSQVVPLGGRPVQVRPGYGITIVPLRNISATSAAQFIQPLVASPEDIRIDPGRNAILFSGTGVERQNVVETLADLDVDWMAGKAIGLFPLERANAEAVVPELQAIFAPFDPTGSEPSLIRFLPLARLNAVLAIAGDPEQMREVGSWVSRLDRGQAAGSQFYVYNLKHGAAEDVAKLLNEAFSEGPASSTGPSLAAASAALGAPQSLNEDGESIAAGIVRRAAQRRTRRIAHHLRAGQGRGQQGQQLAADPGHAGGLRPDRGHAGAPRHGTLAGADRGHHRRGHAERHAALRRPVLPRAGQLRRRVHPQRRRQRWSGRCWRRASTSSSPPAAARSPSTRCRA